MVLTIISSVFVKKLPFSCRDLLEPPESFKACTFWLDEIWFCAVGGKLILIYWKFRLVIQHCSFEYLYILWYCKESVLVKSLVAYYGEIKPTNFSIGLLQSGQYRGRFFLSSNIIIYIFIRFACVSSVLKWPFEPFVLFMSYDLFESVFFFFCHH